MIDFDGTLTKEELQADDLMNLELDDLVSRFGVQRDKLVMQYGSVKDRILNDPTAYCWEYEGRPASYPDEGAFILNTTVMQELLKEFYMDKVEEWIGDDVEDKVAACTNHLFHTYSSRLVPEFRDGARDLLLDLQADDRFEPVILSNSKTDKIETFLEGMGLPARLRVVGQTKQFVMDRASDHTVLYGEGRRFGLSRPVYRNALDREQPVASIVADTFSLPCVMPAVCGLARKVYLLKTPYTPGWELRIADKLNRMVVLDDISQLYGRLENLERGGTE